MIIDKISNAYLYYGLGAGFETALRETEALAAQPVPLPRQHLHARRERRAA